MACSSCAAKAALFNNKNIESLTPDPVDCLYTREELLEKLEQAVTNENYNQISFIRSALNLYVKDCNMFNDYIL